MPRRILEGEVVSNKTDKTITVLVQRRYMHPVYKKYVKRTDKYAAHDEKNNFKAGDKVQIIECRPISKTKRWVALLNGEALMPPAVKEKAAPAPKKVSAPKKASAAQKEAKPAAEKKAPAKKPAAKSKKED
jgi:small subunit ribosomal protein S17